MVSPSFAAKAIETMFGTNYATSSLTSSIVLENPFNSLHRVDLNAMFKKCKFKNCQTDMTNQ